MSEHGINLQTFQTFETAATPLTGNAGIIYIRDSNGSKTRALTVEMRPADDDGNLYYYSVDGVIITDDELEIIKIRHLSRETLSIMEAYKANPPWAKNNETVFYPPERIESFLRGVPIGVDDINNPPRRNSDGAILWNLLRSTNINDSPYTTTLVGISHRWADYTDGKVTGIEKTQGHDAYSHFTPFRPPQCNIRLNYRSIDPNVAQDTRIRVQIIEDDDTVNNIFTGLVKELSWTDHITAKGNPFYRASLSCYGNSIIAQEINITSTAGNTENLVADIIKQLSNRSVKLTNRLRSLNRIYIWKNISAAVFNVLSNLAASNHLYPARLIETGDGDLELVDSNPNEKPELTHQIQPGTGGNIQFRASLEGIGYSRYNLIQEDGRDITEILVWTLRVNTGRPPFTGRQPTNQERNRYNGSINTSAPGYNPNDVQTWRPRENWRLGAGRATDLRWFWIGPVFPTEGYEYTYTTPDGKTLGTSPFIDSQSNTGSYTSLFAGNTQNYDNDFTHTYQVSGNLTTISGTFHQRYLNFTGTLSGSSSNPRGPILGLEGLEYKFDDEGKDIGVVLEFRVNTRTYEVQELIFPNQNTDSLNVLELQNHPGLVRDVRDIANTTLRRERHSSYWEVRLTNLSNEDILKIDSFVRLNYNYYGNETSGIIIKYTITRDAHTPFWTAKLTLVTDTFKGLEVSAKGKLRISALGSLKVSAGGNLLTRE